MKAVNILFLCLGICIGTVAMEEEYPSNIQRQKPRKKQKEKDTKEEIIKDINQKLKTVAYYNKECQEKQQLGPIVEEMNKEPFLVEKILFGHITHIEGNNTVVEKGIRTRLDDLEKILQDELAQLIQSAEQNQNSQ